eukprot:TRINITY_DN7822_c0_g2_i1.p1 TRINITY_DN7822_c0_g2~~TRINITY_DN7822_c0_g2_i1.p1  ORF type:complete len:115 (+),score=6.24 TRINITY_DN7822_c0_g2_i1:1884-2228(+)
MYYRELKLITWLIMFNNAFHSIYISLPILMPDYHLFFSLFERQKSDINSMLLLLLVKLLLYIFVGKARFPCVALVWPDSCTLLFCQEIYLAEMLGCQVAIIFHASSTFYCSIQP